MAEIKIVGQNFLAKHERLTATINYAKYPGDNRHVAILEDDYYFLLNFFNTNPDLTARLNKLDKPGHDRTDTISLREP